MKKLTPAQRRVLERLAFDGSWAFGYEFGGVPASLRNHKFVVSSARMGRNRMYKITDAGRDALEGK